MSLFKYFQRKGEKVTLQIDSALQVPISTYEWTWNCFNDNYAELLKEQLNIQLLEYKKEIARDALLYLNSREITQMKRALKSWDSRVQSWKSR